MDYTGIVYKPYVAGNQTLDSEYWGAGLDPVIYFSFLINQVFFNLSCIIILCVPLSLQRPRKRALNGTLNIVNLWQTPSKINSNVMRTFRGNIYK